MVTTDASALLSVSQAAEHLEVSPSTIWRWIEAGKLPAYRLGRKKIRIRRDDLEQMLQPTGDKNGVSATMGRIRPPSQAELQRRQALVQKILERREQRVIAPLSSADLVQLGREHGQQPDDEPE